METVLHELRYPLVVFGRSLIVISVVFIAIALLRSRRMGAPAAIKISAAEALLAASLAAIVSVTMLQVRIPLPGDYRLPPMNPNWVPVMPLLQGLLSQEANISALNVAGNIALFIPLGAAIRWRFVGHVRHVLVIALMCSVGIEAYQYVSDLGRSVDINDVLLNVFGAFIGASGMSWLLSNAPDLTVHADPSRRGAKLEQR